VNDGDICAVWWRGGKALKHVFRDRDTIHLVPSDPAYDTIILGPEHHPVTVGLVVAVIRPCE
jgi:SOS-response transcriptional repressor LexA